MLKFLALPDENWMSFGSEDKCMKSASVANLPLVGPWWPKSIVQIRFLGELIMLKNKKEFSEIYQNDISRERLACQCAAVFVALQIVQT